MYAIENFLDIYNPRIRQVENSNCAIGRSLRENLNYGNSTYVEKGPNPEKLCTLGCDPNYPFLGYQTLNTFQDLNTLKDYNVVENETDAGNVGLVQNVNYKHIRLENSSMKPVLVCITNEGRTFPPGSTFQSLGMKPQLMLKTAEVRNLSVNMPGEKYQFIWLFSPIDGKLLNTPHPIRWHINQFVLIEGVRNGDNVIKNNVCNNNTIVQGKPLNIPIKLSKPEFQKNHSLWWIMDFKTPGFKN